MHTRSRWFGAAFIILAMGCGGGGDSGVTGPPGGGGNGGGAPPPVSTNAVGVSNNQFTPSSIVIAVGSTVTWTWGANTVTHNVTFADGGSGNRDANATFTKTFPTAGTFAYHCTLHAGMDGTVKVQ